ncbi:hypothetical protein C8R44DRAFT_18511 [Mycena epipterygia]|nr:hypothetical protein C8R44DRAFT_18511 [Mycena epipterygia]
MAPLGAPRANGNSASLRRTFTATAHRLPCTRCLPHVARVLTPPTRPCRTCSAARACMPQPDSFSGHESARRAPSAAASAFRVARCRCPYPYLAR